MTIIEKIKAEIERLYGNACSEDRWDMGYDCACEDMMSFLIDLEKSEKPINLEGLEEEINRYLEPIHAADIQFEPFTQMTKCARHFYDIGQRSRLKISDNSLEEEIAGMYRALFGTDIINRKEMIYLDTFEAIARHFAQWGAEHLKK